MSTSQTMRRVDLVVATLEGHRPLYLRLCIEHARTIGIECVVHAPGDERALPDHQQDLLELAEWNFSSEPLSLEEIAELTGDRIIVLDGDELGRQSFSKRTPDHQPMIALSLRGQRPSLQRDLRRMIKGLARFVVARRLGLRRNVTVLELASASEDLGQGAHKVRDPIPIEASDSSIGDFRRHRLDAAVGGSDHYWLGLIGVINRRKNVALVADAIIRAGETLEKPALLIAGPIDGTIRGEIDSAIDRLRRAGVPVVVLDQLLDDCTLDSAIGAVNSVVVAYGNDGPSAVLGKAARLGVKATAAGSHVLRRDVEALSLGAWGTLDVAGLAAALAATQQAPHPKPATLFDPQEFGRRLLEVRPLRILAWPAFRHRWGNPYTAELADGLAQSGHQLEEFGLNRNLIRRADAILVHWPEFAPTHRSPLVRWPATLGVLGVFWLHRRLGGAAITWVAHNVNPHRDPSPRLRRWFMNQLVKLLDGVIALNEVSLRNASDLYPGLANKKRLVTRHPVYEPSERPIDPSRADSSSWLADIDPDATVLAIWGRIDRYKQVKELLEQSVRLGSEVAVVVAGRCDDQSLAAELRILERQNPDRIMMTLGHLDDESLTALLARADAAAFNFSEITNSGSVIASLSAGVPVIAPRHPGLEELQFELGDDWVRLFDPPLHTDDLAKLISVEHPTTPMITEFPAFQWPTVIGQTDQFLRSTVESRARRSALGRRR